VRCRESGGSTGAHLSEGGLDPLLGEACLPVALPLLSFDPLYHNQKLRGFWLAE
jgi:hypothetical protein